MEEKVPIIITTTSDYQYLGDYWENIFGENFYFPAASLPRP